MKWTEKSNRQYERSSRGEDRSASLSSVDSDQFVLTYWWLGRAIRENDNGDFKFVVFEAYLKLDMVFEDFQRLNHDVR